MRTHIALAAAVLLVLAPTWALAVDAVAAGTPDARTATETATATTTAKATEAATATTAEPDCVLTESAYDARQLRCSWPAAGISRHYRLQVDFTGGHDDTVARLIESGLAGAPLTCDMPASKTALQGEDGNVSLSCLFALPTGAERISAVFGFRWSHAQYVGYSMRPVP